MRAAPSEPPGSVGIPCRAGGEGPSRVVTSSNTSNGSRVYPLTASCSRYTRRSSPSAAAARRGRLCASSSVDLWVPTLRQPVSPQDALPLSASTPAPRGPAVHPPTNCAELRADGWRRRPLRRAVMSRILRRLAQHAKRGWMRYYFAKPSMYMAKPSMLPQTLVAGSKRRGVGAVTAHEWGCQIAANTLSGVGGW